MNLHLFYEFTSILYDLQQLHLIHIDVIQIASIVSNLHRFFSNLYRFYQFTSILSNLHRFYVIYMNFILTRLTRRRRNNTGKKIWNMSKNKNSKNSKNSNNKCVSRALRCYASSRQKQQQQQYRIKGASLLAQARTKN